MSIPVKIRVCRWCGQSLGVIDEWLLICEVCDFVGDAGPPHASEGR